MIDSDRYLRDSCLSIAKSNNVSDVKSINRLKRKLIRRVRFIDGIFEDAIAFEKLDLNLNHIQILISVNLISSTTQINSWKGVKIPMVRSHKELLPFLEQLKKSYLEQLSDLGMTDDYLTINTDHPFN